MLIVSSRSTLVWSSAVVSSHHPVLIQLSAHMGLMLHDLQKLLQDLSHVRMRGELLDVDLSSLLSLILFKISFVNGIFNLDLSLLLDLIVVNDESFSIVS